MMGIDQHRGEKSSYNRGEYSDTLLGDRAYDAEEIRRTMRARGILPPLAMRNTRHGTRLGRWRWVVERTFAWLNQFRRLPVRYERRADMHIAFLSLALHPDLLETTTAS